MKFSISDLCVVDVQFWVASLHQSPERVPNAAEFQTISDLKSLQNREWHSFFSKSIFFHFAINYLVAWHTAWIWIWMTKRPGATSDNCFIFKKINENLNNKREEKSCEPFWRAGLTGDGQSSQSADFWKIAKMVLFNPCMKVEFLGLNDFIWSGKCTKNTFSRNGLSFGDLDKDKNNVINNSKIFHKIVN